MLQERVDAVEDILSVQSAKLVMLRNLLKGLPDLAKGLCRIQYGKVSIFLIGLRALYLSFRPVHTSRTRDPPQSLQQDWRNGHRSFTEC